MKNNLLLIILEDLTDLLGNFVTFGGVTRRKLREREISALEEIAQSLRVIKGN